MEKTGQIIRRRIAIGTKSERDAVILSTSDGDYILRRTGKNPYSDPDLEKLIGKTVRSTGEMTIAGTFLAQQITPIEPD